MSEINNKGVAPGDCVVVIGRQFGSGGRMIGKIIANRLGIDYYDKELLSQAATSLGFSQEIFAAADEKKPSPLRSLLQGLSGVADNFHATSLSGEKLYKEQSDVIRTLAQRGSCVIVGRTADYVLRDHPGLISVFLHAPMGHRASKIIARGDAPNFNAASEIARKHDRDREGYYNYFTGRHWGRADNYHLSIDASTLTEEEAADLIISYCRAKIKTKK